MHITCDHLQTTNTKLGESSADTSTDKEVIRVDLLEVHSYHFSLLVKTPHSINLTSSFTCFARFGYCFLIASA